MVTLERRPSGRLRRALGRLLGAAGVVVLTLMLLLRLLYGGGEPYADLTGPPHLPDAVLEVAASSPEPVGNLAVSADGRLFFTIHPESRPEGVKLYESREGRLAAFPPPEVQRRLFDTPLGLRVDRQGRLWVVDHGSHGLRGARLYAFDLASGRALVEMRFPREAAPRGSFLQDLVVDQAGETVYVADVGFWRRRPGLVVYDVGTRTARRLLDGHAAVMPQPWLIRNPIRTMTFFGGVVALRPGLDGIALSPDDEWLYLGAMAHDTLYRVRTRDVRDGALAPEGLAGRVEAVGRKPLSDGLSTDLEGNVLITDVEHGAVLRLAPGGALRTLVKSPRVRWADGLSHGPDGWLYLADSAIPHQMLRSKAHIAAQAPYFVFRFRPGIAGIPGR